MAAKKPAKSTDQTVVRITAKDEKPAAKKQTPSIATPKRVRRNPLRAIGGYFVGAWQELREVRWPNRNATWSLTAAMLGFTAFFVVLILLLDALYKYVFQLILG